MKLTNEQKRSFVKDDYNAIAKLYSEDIRNLDLYSSYIDKFINSLKGKTVLDVGCASGEFTNYIKNQGINIKGLDFSKNLIEIAKENYTDIEFINIDITEFETDEKFDGIFSKDTLFHLPDDDLVKVISNFHNLLTADGKLLIILDIPKQDGEEIYDEPLDTRYKLYYNYLTVEKVETLLKNYGFKIEKSELINNTDNLYIYAKGIMAIYASVS